MADRLQEQLDAALADAAKYKKDAKAYKKDVKSLRKANEKMEAEMAEFAELVAKSKADLARTAALEQKLAEAKQQLQQDPRGADADSDGAQHADAVVALKRQLAAMEAENAEATSQLASLRIKAADIGKELDAGKQAAQSREDADAAAMAVAQERITNLEGEISRMQSKADAGSKQLEEARELAEAFQNATADLQTKVDNAETDLRAQRDKCGALEAAVQSARLTVRERDESLRITQGTLDATTAQVAKLEERCATAVGVREASDESLAALKRVVAEKSAAVTKLESDLEAKSGVVADLTAEINGQSAAASKLQGQLKTKEATVNELSSKLEKSASALEVCKAALKTSQDELKRSSAELAGVNAEVREVKKDMATQSATADKAASDSATACAALQTSVADRDAAAEKLRSELSTLTTTVSELRNRCESAEAAMAADSDAAAEHAREAITRLERQLSERDATLMKRDSELSSMSSQFEALQKQTETLQRSMEERGVDLERRDALLKKALSKAKELKRELEEERRGHKSASADVEGLRKEVETLQKSVKDRTEEVAQRDVLLKDALTKAKKLTSDLNEERKSRGEEGSAVAEIEVQLAEKDAALAQKEVDTKVLLSDLEAVQRKVADHEAEAAKLKFSLADAVAAAARAVDEHRVVCDEMAALRAELEVTKNDHARVTSDHDAMAARVEVLEAEMKSVRNLEVVAQSAEAEARTLTSKLAAAEDLVEKLRQSASVDMKTEKVRLREKFESKRAEQEEKLRAEFVERSDAMTAEHEKIVAELREQLDPAAIENLKAELLTAKSEVQSGQATIKVLNEELIQLREEHKEVSGIYITAQQERDTAAARAEQLEAKCTELESLKLRTDARIVDLSAAVSELESAQTTAAAEAANAAKVAQESAEAELAKVRTALASKLDNTKADLKAAKTEAKSQRKARQRIETEISELAESVAIERARFAEQARELETVEARHSAEVQDFKESIELMRQLHEGANANSTHTASQTDEPWPYLPDGNGAIIAEAHAGAASLEAPLAIDNEHGGLGKEAVADEASVPELTSPNQLEQSAWCSWERASVRRRTRGSRGIVLADGNSPKLTQRAAAAAAPRAPEPRIDQWPEEAVEKIGQKEEEIKFLQRALMKNVELAAHTKKEENDLRREYKTCKNQLDLLVALENEDEEAAAKLRQDIVTKQYRAQQVKLKQELAEAHKQVGDLQEMLMLQRQVRFDRVRSASPGRARAEPALRVVHLERLPGRQLGIMLNEDPDGHFKELGVRVAGVRKGSIADESNEVFMGDAVVWINDIWCFRSSFREVINYMKNSGDLVTLRLASSIDLGECSGEEAFLQPAADRSADGPIEN